MKKISIVRHDAKLPLYFYLALATLLTQFKLKYYKILIHLLLMTIVWETIVYNTHFASEEAERQRRSLYLCRDMPKWHSIPLNLKTGSLPYQGFSNLLLVQNIQLEIWLNSDSDFWYFQLGTGIMVHLQCTCLDADAASVAHSRNWQKVPATLTRRELISYKQAYEQVKSCQLLV